MVGRFAQVAFSVIRPGDLDDRFRKVQDQLFAIFGFNRGKQADIFEKFVKKGQEIAVEGKLVTRSYETKEGEKRYRTEIQVSEFLMLGAKEEVEG